MIEPDVLVHLTTPATWRVALAAGSLATPSLVTDGFIHLSTPDQVPLPADALFAGRDDVLLLVIDPSRLRSPVRWEAGTPGDPAAMRFPHLYGPLPTAAVTSVLPYRPGPSGSYDTPLGLPSPGDALERAASFDRSLVQRRAVAVLPVVGGVAVLDPRVPSSYEHNALWLTGAVDAETVIAEADRTMGGCAHRRAVFDRRPPPGLGWALQELRLMVLDPTAPTPEPSGEPVVAATSEVMAGLWRVAWRRQLPDVAEAVIDDLVRREPFADAHVRIVDLAVLDPSGAPVAGAQLRIDGATAAIEAVMTEPHVQHLGYARALLGDAIGRARALDCDVVLLLAAADDWPRHWYARLGFADVGERWEATAS
jgi:uncharacterized protein (DUF952 family)/GNAT superfamily N-acetyltransferase